MLCKINGTLLVYSVFIVTRHHLSGDLREPPLSAAAALRRSARRRQSLLELNLEYIDGFPAAKSG